jgi:hypothetical protein
MAQSSTAKLRLARVRRKTPRNTGASPYFMIRLAGPTPDRDGTSHHAHRRLQNDLETTVGWVISRHPAHPALVSEADYIAAQEISAVLSAQLAMPGTGVIWWYRGPGLDRAVKG